MTTKPTVVADLSESRKNISFQHYLALFLWLGWLFTLPLFFFVIVVSYFYSKIVFTILLGILVFASIYPLSKPFQPSFGTKIGDWMMTMASQYFGLILVIENRELLNKSKVAIVSLEPHDVLPVSIFAFAASLGYFHVQKLVGCLSGSCFSVPFMRHFYTWAKATSVDKKNLQKLCK